MKAGAKQVTQTRKHIWCETRAGGGVRAGEDTTCLTKAAAASDHHAGVRALDGQWPWGSPLTCV